MVTRELRKAGRPRKDGTQQEGGEPVVKFSITVFADQCELAELLGNGNRSAGFRFLADYYLATQRGDENAEN